jgi:hypothetical protein
MKKQLAVSLYFGGFLVASIAHAADLKQSKFTQVVNDVRVISSANNLEKPAAVNEVFNMPDLVRTGASSRAELVAEDKTITRVGANTIFSFDPASRTIDLRQGSLLFHSPKGKGGGTIRTSSATASVLGTTLIVTTTRSGGFKVIDLEGHVAIKFLNGIRQDLYPGQMTFVLAGGHPAPVLTIRLDTLAKESHLVQGFAAPLPSMPLIQQQVDAQVKQIESGQAQDTGLLVGDEASSSSVQVVQIDPNTIPAARTNNGPADAVTINSPMLDPTFISTISGPTSPPIVEFMAPDTKPNIFINTPWIDLGPYAQTAAFEFFAPDTLTINGSVAFNNFPKSSSSFLGLTAGNQLLIAPGSTVQADVGQFSLMADGPSGMTLSGVNVVDHAPTGIVIIDALSSLSLANGSSIQAQNLIDLFSNNAVSITGSSLVAANSVNITSFNGSVTLSGSTLNTGSLGISAAGSVTVTSDVSHSFQVNNVSVSAGNGIFVDGGDSSPQLSIGAAKPGKIDLTAVNLLTAQNLKLDSMTVNLTANTINLSNVAFSNGSTVTLTSSAGVLNTNGLSISGDVNFITNVTYGGLPAQSQIVSSGPGVIIK